MKKKQVFPAPPDHLSERAKALWKSIGPTHARSLERQQLFRSALECLDRVDAARQLIQAEGLVSKTEGSGVRHTHPCVKVEREARAQFTKLWQVLDLDWNSKVDGDGWD